MKLAKISSILNSSSAINSGKTTLDIIRFSLIQDGKITTTNLEQELTYDLTLDGVDNVLVPTKKLAELLTTFSGEVNLTLKNGRLHVKQGRISASVPIREDVENFPIVTEFNEDEPYQEIDLTELKGQLEQAKIALAQDLSRPILTGLHWGKSMQSTDGFRMVNVNGVVAGNNSVVIPGNGILGLIKLLPSEGVAKSQVIHNSKILFKFDTFSYSVQLLGGQYPDISTFISDGFATQCKVEVKSFIQAVKQGGVYAKEQFGNMMELVIAENGIFISVHTQEDGDYENQIDITEFKGLSVKTAVNYEYLLQALQKCTSAYVEFGTTSEGSNVPMKLVDGDFQAVIMAMHIKEKGE